MSLNELREKLRKINFRCSESYLYEILETIEMAIEDGSEFVYITDGYEDIEFYF